MTEVVLATGIGMANMLAIFFAWIFVLNRVAKRQSAAPPGEKVPGSFLLGWDSVTFVLVIPFVMAVALGGGVLLASLMLS